MKYAVASEHRDFFQKNGAIEFEGLFSQEQLDRLDSSINQVLQARLKIDASKLEKESSEKQFYAGRDLWRDSPTLKKIITHSMVAEIASELIQYKPLRLGYDQYFPSVQRIGKFSTGEPHAYAKLIDKEKSLNDISSLQGILCGLMICTKSFKISEPSVSDEASPVNIFALKAGNAVFIAPDKVIDFRKLQSQLSNNYLLVVYTSPATLYVLREEDSHTHALKRLGYVFGDKLSDKLNPIIYR